MVVTREFAEVGKGEVSVRRDKVAVYGINKSREQTYSTMTLVNNTALNTGNLFRE